MRALLIVCLAALSAPASAGCRLSTADCAVVAQEMANEEVAAILSERRHYLLNPFQRLEAERKDAVARIKSRSQVLKEPIRSEYFRELTCDTQEKTAIISGQNYVPSTNCE